MRPASVGAEASVHRDRIAPQAGSSAPVRPTAPALIPARQPASQSDGASPIIQEPFFSSLSLAIISSMKRGDGLR